LVLSTSCRKVSKFLAMAILLFYSSKLVNNHFIIFRASPEEIFYFC
jgi:hypothetical protein